MPIKKLFTQIYFNYKTKLIKDCHHKIIKIIKILVYSWINNKKNYLIGKKNIKMNFSFDWNKKNNNSINKNSKYLNNTQVFPLSDDF